MIAALFALKKHFLPCRVFINFNNIYPLLYAEAIFSLQEEEVICRVHLEEGSISPNYHFKCLPAHSKVSFKESIGKSNIISLMFNPNFNLNWVVMRGL